MGEIYWEENHYYQIDLRNTEWSLAPQTLYRNYNLSLADVDWICEFNGEILLIEYKNAKLPFEKGYRAAENFNPSSDESVAKIVRKFFDSFFVYNVISKKKTC